MTNSYDQVPYPSHAYTRTHPDVLATLATLLGLGPAPVEHCRVLELGCAGGGNLIPMALSLPESQFLGIDYASRQIADGNRAVAALGLKNIEFRHMDIRDVTVDLGQFDYIIAHGVYSWVPEAVRDKILGICNENLAPNGVAYVSYNTFPGWYMLGMFRELLLYHTRSVDDPQMRVAQARDLLEFLAGAVPGDDNVNGLLQAYSALLQLEVERWKESSPSFLVHDELEEVNEPIYFYQFAEQARRHGLQYLCEVEFRRGFPDNYPPQVAEKLLKLAHSIIEMEQYIDFVRGETFRKTLLVHQTVSFSRSIKADCLPKLYVASPAVPVSANPDLHSISAEQFRVANGATLTTDHPATKAAMMCLREVWPAVIPFTDLLDKAYARLDASKGCHSTAATPAQRSLDTQVMGTNLLKAYIYHNDLVELRTYAPRLVTRVSERPVGAPWARYLAQDHAQVTNLRHERVDLNDIERYLLRHLEGQHDRADLLADLSKAAAEGMLAIEQEGQPIQDAEKAQPILAGEIERHLNWLAHCALLIE